MQPDIIILFLSLFFIFFAFSIHSLMSFFKRSSPVSASFIIGLLILLISTFVLFTIAYNLLDFRDLSSIVYYVILLLAFSISINISQLISQKIKAQHKVRALSITFCILTVVLSCIITLIFYYSVGFIESAKILRHE